MIFDVVTGACLNLPDDNCYPGVEIVRLFIAEQGARSVIERTKTAGSSKLRNAVFVPVPLLKTRHGVAIKRDTGEKIGFVVHGPGKVYDFFVTGNTRNVNSASIATSMSATKVRSSAATFDVTIAAV